MEDFLNQQETSVHNNHVPSITFKSGTKLKRYLDQASVRLDEPIIPNYLKNFSFKIRYPDANIKIALNGQNDYDDYINYNRDAMRLRALKEWINFNNVDNNDLREFLKNAEDIVTKYPSIQDNVSNIMRDIRFLLK
ncbi:hypothetical protein [Trichoplusia ni ascovirus 6b]|nr:hypothetical protein [Trichoplusia ni ascovirus 6b]